MDAELTVAALGCARTVLGEVRLLATETLRDLPGWSVARLSLETGSGPQSVIVKTARPRERAALEVLAGAGSPVTPRLLAACDEPALVLMSDAGSGPSVATRLLGDDPDEAAAAVARWAEAIARVQATSLDLGPEFRQRLAELAAAGPEVPPPDVYRNRFARDRAVGWKVAVTRPASGPVIAETSRGLRDGLAPLGVAVGPDAAAALQALATRLTCDPPGPSLAGGSLDDRAAGSGGPAALTPCDGCPDNNVDAPGGLVLVDFEGADVRHVAWDAAYLTVPWPSCWCSWRMPATVQAAALARWRSILEPQLAPAAAAGLDAAIRDATVAWALITTAWFIGAAHRDQPLGPGGAMRPGPRQLIQHRLGVAAAADPDGVLGRLAARAVTATRAAWGDCPLPLAPAWR